MAEIIHLNQEKFNTLTNTPNSVILLDFFATW